MTAINGRLVSIGGRPFYVNDPIIPVRLGVDRNGIEQVLDLGCCRNIFIASPDFSKKEGMLDRILKGVVDKMYPSQVKFLFSSFDKSILRNFGGGPRMIVPIISSEWEAVRALDYLYDENTRRYQLFKKAKADWIVGYNNSKSTMDKLPFLIYVIDEVAPLMKNWRAEFCRKVHQVAMSSRFTGVLLLFATSEITSEVVRESLISSFPKRIIFRMENEEQSRMIMGTDGAEKLGDDKIFLLEPPKDKPKKIKLVG